MMRHLLAVGGIVCVMAASPLRAASPWDGTYVWEQGLGKNPGGIALFVTHTLKIDGGTCRLDAEGVQTNEHILCKATPNGESLDVSFVSFADGGMVNQFGKKVYSPNQPLFTLKRQGDTLTTTWKGYIKNDADTTGKSTFIRKAGR